MKKHRLLPAPLALGSWGAAFILASLLPLLLPADWSLHRVWKGYYSLHLQESPRLARLAADLRSQRGVSGLVSRYTTAVSFNRFAGFDSVTLDRLPGRLDPQDPRLDPFLKNAASYFRYSQKGMNWEVFYVRSQRNLSFLEARLWGLLSGRGVRWRVLEFDPPAALLQLLLLIIFAVLLFVDPEPVRPRWLAWSSLLPWLVKIVLGDFLDLLTYFLIFPVWARVLAEFAQALREYILHGRKGSMLHNMSTVLVPRLASRTLVYSSALGIAMFILVVPDLNHLLSTAIAAAAGLLLVALLKSFLIGEKSRRAHPPFQALLILRHTQIMPAAPGSLREAWRPGNGRVRRLLLVLLVLLAFPSLMMEKHLAGLEVTRLHPPADRQPIWWQSLEKLPLVISAGSLPSLADYVAHRAFQESLSFGRPYAFPSQGERLRISSYRISPAGQTVQQSFRVVKRFTADWLKGVLASPAPGSLPRLLLDQGRAAAVERVHELALLQALRPGLRSAAAAVFLLVFFFRRDFGLTAALLFGTRSFAPRRKPLAV